MADTLTPDEVVPAFRSDLKLADPVQGAGEKLVTVADPTSGKSMAFRGFELSIARMLNGQRTAQEVVDSAGAIGLPISLEGLSGFVHKLRSLGFLSHPLDAPVEAPSTWTERREWSDEIRARYQLALKEARGNELLSAKKRLEELRQDAPDNSDVEGLLQWVDERLRAPTVGKKLPTFTDVFSVVERTWFEQAERQSAENAKAQEVEAKRLASLSDVPAVVESGAEPPSQSIETPKKKGGAGKFIAVLFLLLLAGAGAVAALYPLPQKVTGSFELAPRASNSIEVARAGVIGSVAAKEGDWLESGATIFSYDADSAKKQLADAEKKLADAQKKVEKSPAGKKVAEARKKLEKAQAELRGEQADLEKLKAKGKKPAISKQEKAVKKAEAAVNKAQKAFDTANAGLSGDGKAELEKALAERDAAKAHLEPEPFKAPVAGFVRALKVKGGDAVKVGDSVCQLEDVKVLTAKMAAPKGETLIEGQVVSLTVAGKPLEVKVEKIINGEARGSVDNAKGELKPGEKGSFTTQGKGRTLLSKFL